MHNMSHTYWCDQFKAALTLITLAVVVLIAYTTFYASPTDLDSAPRPSVELDQETNRGPAILSKAICTEYRVSCQQTRETLRVLMDEAQKQEIDVALAVGLALQESGFQPHKKSSTGDHGLLQVNYRWHKSDVRRLADLYDVRTNARVGLGFLKTLLSQSKSTYEALRRYNGANGTSPYPEGVMTKAQWAAQFI